MPKQKINSRISEWEIYQCFDRGTGEYIPLDYDTWLDKHRIREVGAKRGKKNQPNSAESQKDDIHLKIETWISDCARTCKEAVTTFMNEKVEFLNDTKSAWDKNNPEINVDALVDKCSNDLQFAADQAISNIHELRAEYNEAAHDLKHFREKHNLGRVAHYPDNQLAHWLWIAVAAIVESFVGANLLGSVSRGGVIEGWMVAIVLTFVNILLGVAAGYIWRLKNYRFGIRKVSAYLLDLSIALVALGWNVIAGHVRDLYVKAEQTGQFESLDTAFATACLKLIEQPLPWESLQSAGLALVGIAVFFATTLKMYLADDPFPGYGMKHRKLTEKREHYRTKLNEARKNLELRRNKAKYDIQTIKERFEMDKSTWNNTLNKLKTTRENYPANLSQFDKYLEYLIAAYRQANLEVRKSDAPSFFAETPSAINKEELQLPEVEIPKPPDWGNINEKAENGLTRLEETYKTHLERFQMLNQVADDKAR